MKKKYNFVAIILARGGSKGIKNKNLTKVNGKPLLHWSIQSCKNSKKINSYWVSSDSKKILNFALKNKAKTILRPKKFSTSKALSESAWIHAIKELEKKQIKFDCVVGIQPTSPIRERRAIDKAINLFQSKKYDSVFSAYESHIFVWKKKNNKILPNYNIFNRPMRQKIGKQYIENGSIYIFNKNKFLKIKNRLFGKIGLYIMKKFHSFEIDNLDDIRLINNLKYFFNSK